MSEDLIFKPHEEKSRDERKKDWFNGIELQAQWLNETIAWTHKSMLDMVWNSPEFTAAEYFEKSGVNGLKKLQLSKALQEISALANPSYVPFEVPNEISINDDGSVIVGKKINNNLP